MSDVLRFPIKENGLYSSLPYASMWIVSIALGFVSDWMITRNHISITNARKLFTTIGESLWELSELLTFRNLFQYFIILISMRALLNFNTISENQKEQKISY